MLDVGTLYFAVSAALLLVALGVGLRVLRGIAREGRERRRRRRAGEVQKHAEDEEHGRDAPAASEGDLAGSEFEPAASVATCPQCGADNESGFDYCRRCAAPLGPGS